MQGEARMVPRAADLFAVEHTLLERPSVVRALGADGEPVRVDVREQNRLPEGMAQHQLTRTNAAHLNPFCEIWPGQLVGRFAHFRWSRRFESKKKMGLALTLDLGS